MPRIDPSQLLSTLHVLLAPDGGIRSADDVSTSAYSLPLSCILLIGSSLYSPCCVSAELYSHFHNCSYVVPRIKILLSCSQLLRLCLNFSFVLPLFFDYLVFCHSLILFSLPILFFSVPRYSVPSPFHRPLFCRPSFIILLTSTLHTFHSFTSTF